MPVINGAAVAQPRDYELLSLLGRGDGVTRYDGRHTLTGRPVGVQVIEEKVRSTPGLVAAVVASAREMAHWHDPGAVAVWDVLIEGDAVLLVTEPATGVYLGEMIEAGRSLPAGEVPGVNAAVLGTLERAHHQGFAHGRVGVWTVLVEASGRVRVDGFVLSRARESVAGHPPTPETDARAAQALADLLRGTAPGDSPKGLAAPSPGGSTVPAVEGLAKPETASPGPPGALRTPSRGRRRRTLGAAAVLLVALALLAVAGRRVLESNPGTPPATAPLPGQAVQLQALLAHVPAGLVTLRFSPTTGSLTVDMTLMGLAPGTHHPAHIHRGSCTRQSAVIYPLRTVPADSEGRAHLITTVPLVREHGIPVQGWYVNVHNGPGFGIPAEFEPLVCVDVTNPGAGDSLTLALTQGPPGTPSQAAIGTAAVDVRGDHAAIAVEAAGLAPASSGAMELRAGSCDHLGRPVTALPRLTADQTGRASETATASLPAVARRGTLVLVVHRGAGAGGQASDDIILCGDLTTGPSRT